MINIKKIVEVIDPLTGYNHFNIYTNQNKLIQTEKMNTKEHYQKNTINGLDVIDMIKIFNLNFNEGNILKYLLRQKGQNIQDLEKIIDYAKRELTHIKHQENDENVNWL